MTEQIDINMTLATSTYFFSFVFRIVLCLGLLLGSKVQLLFPVRTACGFEEEIPRYIPEKWLDF